MDEPEDEFHPFEDHYADQPAITIVSEDSVDQVLKEALKTIPAADDMFQAAAWVIARSPMVGKVMHGTKPERRVLKLLTVEQVKNPVLLLRYYLERHQAIVDRIEFLPYDKTNTVSPASYVYSRKAGK